jgi:hypothetical protein
MKIDRRSLMFGLAHGAAYAAADTHLPFEGGSAYYKRFANGPSADPSHFPIAVWLQSPARAAAYKEIGINLMVGLWKGPTAEQLTALAEAGMPVMCAQSEFGLAAAGNPIIRGWTLRDEPDNAQSKPGGGYGPCIAPSAMVEQYRRWKEADPTRPVYLNLGQGVVNQTYKGRGPECARHDEHYPEYARAADIVSFDVYPVNSGYPLWWTGDGVERLRKWAGYQKPVWNWIEASAIRGGERPSPRQIRAQVWMSIIHGSLGIGYFCHQFQPRSDEAAPLHHEETRRALAAINAQVKSVAGALNTPTVGNGVTVETKAPVDTMLKRHGGATYLFAMGARPGGPASATFRLRGCGDTEVAVMGEDRTIRAQGGVFADRFEEYEVHLYRIPFLPAGGPLIRDRM